jgi:hypothetical protein
MTAVKGVCVLKSGDITSGIYYVHGGGLREACTKSFPNKKLQNKLAGR